MKQRMHKATQHRIKLRNLKIPALRARLRLHRGGIQPVAIWGVESQGLAPRYALAKQLGHHNGGILDVTYDIHSNKYVDPGDQIITHHIRATPNHSKPGKPHTRASKASSTHGKESKAQWLPR